MESIRFIPTRTHGVVDYGTGVVLVLAPWIFQFSDVAAAKWISIVAGIALLALSVITNYELALLQVVPVHLHLVADAILGVFLIASPWLFGLSDDATKAWLPFVLIGLAEIGVAAVSDPWPSESDARRRESRLVHRAV